MAFPKDLRQRMINLMYLVLMALLALQIDASTLLAFKQVNRGLENAGSAFDNQNLSIMTAISDKAKEKGGNSIAAQFLKQAEEVKKQSNDAQAFLDQVISEVTTMSTNEEGEFDDYSKDASNLVMLNEEGSKHRAPEVKAKLENVRAEFEKIIKATPGLDDDEKAELIQSIPITTDIPEGMENPDNLDWENFTYRGKPSVALLTLLKQAKNDVKTSEGAIIGKFAQKLDIDNLKFDQFKAAVIPSSTYLQQGDAFKADIFLAASSSQGGNNYTVTVNGRNVPVNSDGVATYTATSGIGEHSINGQITVRNPETGEVTTVPFDAPVKYQVAAPSATVSADKMNVMYVGLDNPISVSAAGVPLGSVTANCSGCTLTKQGPGQYNARVSSQGKATVSVSANGKNMGSKEFRVMTVPDPTPKLGTKKNGGVFSTGELAVQSFVQADLENFVFDAKFKVQSFDMWLVSPGKSSWRGSASGPQLTGQMKQNLGRVGPGWRVVIANVKASGPDGTTRDIGGAIYAIR